MATIISCLIGKSLIMVSLLISSEKAMAPHSSTLAWKIQGPGEPGGLPSVGSHRVEHDWSDLTAAATVSIIVPNHNHFVSDCGVGGRGVSAGSRLYERESWTWPLTSSVSFFIFTIMTIIVFITESLWRSRSLILFTHTHTHTHKCRRPWFDSWVGSFPGEGQATLSSILGLPRWLRQ